MDDAEVVRVGLSPAGEPVSVHVEQRLVVHGVGDFDMKVLGPAADVEGTPQPGLRQGTVIWQGFSPGTKELVSTVTLRPADERDRLPLRVAIGATSTTLTNATVSPATLPTGPAEAAAVSRVAVQVNRALAARQVPTGLPPLASRGPVTTERRPIGAPLHVTGTIGTTPVDVLLTDSTTVAATGEVKLAIEPVLPASAGPALVDVAAALAQVVRVQEASAYLGVTVPGPSTTRFEYATAHAPPPPPPVPAEQVDWGTIALSAIAAAALGLVALGSLRHGRQRR